MAQPSTAKPVKTFRCGNMRASVWRNKSNKDGRIIARHSVRIQKRFRKGDGSYETTDCLFPDDLPRLVTVAQEAFKFICLKDGKASEEETPA
jgi:hypothetical protein